MNCCDDYSQCTQGTNCPVRETRGQLLAAERKWGEMPIQFVGGEPDTDEAVLIDMLEGVALALAGVLIGVAVGTAVYFY